MRFFPKLILLLICSGTLACPDFSVIAKETNEVLVGTNTVETTIQNSSSVREAFDQERSENWELEHESDEENVAQNGAERLPILQLAAAFTVLGVTAGLAAFFWKRRTRAVTT